MTLETILQRLAMPLIFVLNLIETLLFMLVQWYDTYVYSPLQTSLWPLVLTVPRTTTIKGHTVTVFTANIVSWGRTFLVVPIAVSLKYGWPWTGFLLVLLHDFLDHLDGIVAKVHRAVLGPVDDPLLGGFMDAFCDKIVNVFSLWSILMVTDFSGMTSSQCVVYVTSCVVIIVYEFVLGVVRVQDYFRAYYLREFQKDDGTSASSTASVMEGKLKEKLESMGIAALCVAQGAGGMGVAGIVGVTCLLLSVRLAHSSLTNKMAARAKHMRSQTDDEKTNSQQAGESDKYSKHIHNSGVKITFSSGTQTEEIPEELSRQSSCNDDTFEENYDDHIDYVNNTLQRCFSMPGTQLFPDADVDSRASRVYTIGCFDMFHHGHVTLLNRMRTFGRKVIVGVHDSRSIYKLKKRVPVDSTTTRMRHVKQFADEVFCVAGTDPTSFIDSIFDRKEGGSAVYIRGDDMQQFPARSLVESVMSVKFLPYTEGVSSTVNRKSLYGTCTDVRIMDGYADQLTY